MVELLPPVGWADIATKQDVALVRTELHALEDRVGRSMAGMGVQTAVIALVVGLT